MRQILVFVLCVCVVCMTEYMTVHVNMGLVCKHICTCHGACVKVIERFMESVLSFHYVGPRKQIQSSNLVTTTYLLTS